MGYYVSITQSTWMIKADGLEKAFEAVCLLNKRDDLKRGGSSTGEKWFSWMPGDYDKTVSSVEAVFELLGFYTDMQADGLHLTGYDSKTGQEDLFLAAVSPWSEGFIEWRGEDGEMWRHVVDPASGDFLTLIPRISWST